MYLFKPISIAVHWNGWAIQHRRNGRLFRPQQRLGPLLLRTRESARGVKEANKLGAAWKVVPVHITDNQAAGAKQKG